MKEITIYSDGSCVYPARVGGWGYIIISEFSLITDCGGELDTTHNKMELLAVIKALSSLASPHQVSLYSDSEYVVKGINSWMNKWKAKGWKRDKKGSPVLNLDLWKEIDHLKSIHQLKCIWVKSHNGDTYNELADSLATQGRENL